MTSGTLTIPSMGQPFNIGSLYDSRTSKIIPGIKLFTKEQKENMLTETENISMETDIVTEVSMLDKTSDTSINGHLSLSLLSGAISASGSGNYKTNSLEKKETESAIYQIKVHGKYAELNFPPGMKLKGSESFRDATHVVVGIQYGGAAMFFFERSKEDSSTKDKTGGGLSAQIGKFASLLSISGSASLDMTSEETKAMQKIRVAYKGDFHLASPPTNFIEAMKCIQSIQGATARSPITVSLVPLSLLVEKIQPVPMPLSTLCISKAVRCYKVLNGALISIGETIDKLKSSVWIHVLKKLEAEFRELRSFKASLDDAVLDAVQSRHSGSAEGTKNVEERLSFFDSEKKYAHLLEWANAVAEAVDVLVVISDKFREMGAQVISSQAQRASFVMGSSTEKYSTLHSLSCPMKIFEVQQFNPIVGIKLWSDQEEDKRFYQKLVKLGQTTGNQRGEDSRTRIAVEQSDNGTTDAKEAGVQLTHEDFHSGIGGN